MSNGAVKEDAKQLPVIVSVCSVSVLLDSGIRKLLWGFTLYFNCISFVTCEKFCIISSNQPSWNEYQVLLLFHIIKSVRR
jgi:hypothetical protein